MYNRKSLTTGSEFVLSQYQSIYSVKFSALSKLRDAKCLMKRREPNLVNTANMLRAREFGVRVPVEARHFSVLKIVHTGSGTQKSSHLMKTGVLSRGKSCRGVKFTYIHLIPG